MTTNAVNEVENKVAIVTGAASGSRLEGNHRDGGGPMDSPRRDAMHTEGLVHGQTESAQHGALLCLQIPSPLCRSAYRKSSLCGDVGNNGNRSISLRSTAATPARMRQGEVQP